MFLPLLPRTLEAAVRDMSSGKPEMRLAAIKDLVRHARGEPEVRARAIPLLVERLGDGIAHVRAEAAVALGDLVAKEGVAALIVATSDDNAHVSQMAINALGEIGDERALARLRCALRDPRPEVRYQAVIAFPRVLDENGVAADASEVDDALFDAVADADPAIAHVALRVAEERLDRGRSLDSRLLARARALVEPRSAAPQGASGTVERSEPVSAHVVLAAAILLAKAGEPRGHQVIVRVVRGVKIGDQAPEKEDERTAVELAGELNLTEVVPDLERRVWGVARFVRDTCSFHARIALARMGHGRAQQEILADLGSSRRDAVSAAVVSAGRARMQSARDAITRLASDAVDPELRREALALLDAPAR